MDTRNNHLYNLNKLDELEEKPKNENLTPVPPELNEEAVKALGNKPMVKVAGNTNLGKWAAAEREAKKRKARNKRNKVAKCSRKVNRKK